MTSEPPNEMEKALLKQFRENVEDVLRSDEEKSDQFLLRWIRARDHNLDKAEDMLRNSMLWRETIGADKILATPKDPWFAKYFPYWLDGTDKWGHPVLEVPLGAWDMRRAMTPEREPYLDNFICRFLEDIMHAIRKSNKNRPSNSWPNTVITVIGDWKGYSYSQLVHWKAVQSMLKLPAVYERYYPEILFKVFFVNCPSIFPMFMALLKPIIAPKTLSKITCLSGQDAWIPVLRQDIDEDQLGHLYGGQRVLAVGDAIYNYSK